jgi:hypothetical protein
VPYVILLERGNGASYPSLEWEEMVEPSAVDSGDFTMHGLNFSQDKTNILFTTTRCKLNKYLQKTYVFSYKPGVANTVVHPFAHITIVARSTITH